MGTILLFNVNKGKKKKIELIAWKLKHEVKVVEKKDLSKPLGNLVGIPVASTEKAEFDAGKIITDKKNNMDKKTIMDKEMMIFSGLDSNALDDFLDMYKENGIEPVKMKAVITQSNIFWTVQKLYEELEEHSR